MCTMGIQELVEAGRGITFEGAGVTGSCKLPRGCWELNSGLLQEQSFFYLLSRPFRLIVIVLACSAQGFLHQYMNSLRARDLV